MAELDDTKERCRITKETLENEIQALEGRFQAEQEKLATGVSNENTAGETGRQKGEEHHNLASDMFSTREECSTNLETFESEQCSLKKIRDELCKVKGDSHAAFFQDCEVSGLEPEEFSVTCVAVSRPSSVPSQSSLSRAPPAHHVRQAGLLN